jgi:hypothetical protein
MRERPVGGDGEAGMVGVEGVDEMTKTPPQKRVSRFSLADLRTPSCASGSEVRAKCSMCGGLVRRKSMPGGRWAGDVGVAMLSPVGRTKSDETAPKV